MWNCILVLDAKWLLVNKNYPLEGIIGVFSLGDETETLNKKNPSRMYGRDFTFF